MNFTGTSWVTEISDHKARLRVYIQPGAKTTEIVGEHNGALKIKISSPPVDGAANSELVSWIAQKLGIKQRDVCLIHGQTSRNKVLEVHRIETKEILRKLHV